MCFFPHLYLFTHSAWPEKDSKANKLTTQYQTDNNKKQYWTFWYIFCLKGLNDLFNSVENMNLSVNANQYTLKKAVSCCGVGLHTGRTVNLCIKPASVNSGIRFFRTDMTPCRPIKAHMNKIVDTRLATTIGEEGVVISTTEHLLAALHAYGIDNADIEIDSHEVPIMDGSAGPFIKLLKSSGKKKQNGYKRVLKINKPIRYQSGDKVIEILPYDGFKVTAEIAFDDSLISTQRFSLDIDSTKFNNEIATARTFGYVEQVEELWANGLALGGSLENVIAIHWNRTSVLNEDGLRYEDEFIRHKVLDIVGDLALLGCTVLGHVKAYKSGHTEHCAFMHQIARSVNCWECYELSTNNDSTILGRAVDSTLATAEGFLMPFLEPNTIAPALA